MEPAIKVQDLKKEFCTDERCHITELSNTPDDPDASIARARVEPGKTTRWHRLKGITERYYILSGKGIVEVGELAPTEVHSGDMVIIPPLVRQRIENTGKKDLIFLAICTPRFVEEAYEDIEDHPVLC
jgi:mannose-6-phosphate isomerase-like protein (cupin superfamily)